MFNPVPSRRGRGARPFSYSTSPSSSLPPDRIITEGLAKEPIKTIDKLSSTVVEKDKAVGITDFEYIGSYNWTKDDTPTIIVPGSPPEWLNKATPYSVTADRGVFFVDQNGFRMPSSVLLPLITAVEHKVDSDGNDSFDWASVDFVTDRNNLRKILRWVDNDAPKDFRIDLQLAGKHTILLNRWEKKTREEFSGYSYGFSFEKASTTPAAGCENSSGHHRIVKYDLNGLKMVVRFEVDACIPSSPVKPSARAAPPSIDDLADSLAGVKLAQPSLGPRTTLEFELSGPSSPAKSTKTKLTVLGGGSYVPQSSVVELTTRSITRQAEYDWKDSYPQLFFSQTPHHFLAVHQRGMFTIVNKRKLASPELEKAAREAQIGLKKLRRVLNVIKTMVIESGQRGRLSLVCVDGILKVYERVSQVSCLPDDYIEKFDS